MRENDSYEPYLPHNMVVWHSFQWVLQLFSVIWETVLICVTKYRRTHAKVGGMRWGDLQDNKFNIAYCMVNRKATHSIFIKLHTLKQMDGEQLCYYYSSRSMVVTWMKKEKRNAEWWVSLTCLVMKCYVHSIESLILGPPERRLPWRKSFIG